MTLHFFIGVNLDVPHKGAILIELQIYSTKLEDMLLFFLQTRIGKNCSFNKAHL